MTELFTLTQTSELNVELTVSKNCDPPFLPHEPPLSFSMGPVDPNVRNPGKNTDH